MNKKTIVLLSIVMVIIIGAAGYAGFATSQPTAPVVQPPQTVAVTTCDVEQSIAAPGKLVNTHTVSIEMPVDGKLEDIFVQPGTAINAGEPLAKLANPESYAALTAQIEVAVLQAQAELDALYNNAPSKEAQLKAELIDAQEELKKAEAERAKLDYPRAGDLTLERATSAVEQAEQGYAMASDFYQSTANLDPANPDRAAALNMLAGAKQQLDQARANLNWYLGKPGTSDFAKADAAVAIAKTKVTEAQTVLDRLHEGVDPIEEAQARAKLAEAQAKLADAQQVEGSGEIRAPFSGVVLEVNARVGETLHTGAAILTLSEPQALEVQANVTEEDYPLLVPGLVVEMFFDARPDVTVQGKLERIVPKRIEGDRPLYNIYVSLNEVPAGLVDGMTADTAITIAKRAGVLCLPRATVRASSGNQTTLKVWNGLTTETRQIEVGLRGDAYVEIVSGLKEGEQVVTK